MTFDARAARHQLAEARNWLNILEQTLPNAITNTLRNLDDGWPQRGDNPGIRSTTPTSTTEQAALNRYHHTAADNSLNELAQWLTDATRNLRNAGTWTAQRTRRINTDDQRCNGGTPSIADWTRPDCTNLVDHYRLASGATRPRGDGLCTACRKRKERHEQDIIEQHA